MTKNRAAKKDVRAAQAAFGGKYTDHLNAMDYWGGAEVTMPTIKHLGKPMAPHGISQYLSAMSHEHLDGALLTVYLIQQNVIAPDSVLDWLEQSEVRNEIKRAYDWSKPVADERTFAQRIIAVIKPIEECWLAYCRVEEADVVGRTFSVVRYSGARRMGDEGRQMFIKGLRYECRTNSYAIPLSKERISLITEGFSHPALQGVPAYNMRHVAYIYDAVGDANYVRRVLDAVPVTEAKDAHPGFETFQWGVDFKADVQRATKDFIGVSSTDPAVRAVLDDPETNAKLRRTRLYIDADGLDREITADVHDEEDDLAGVAGDLNGNPMSPEIRREQREKYHNTKTRNHTFVK